VHIKTKIKMKKNTKKDSKKHTPKRRRKMSGGVQGMLMQAVGLVGGAVAARILTNSSKILPQIDSKIKDVAAIGLGLYLPKLVKGPIGASVGAGMIAMGGLALLQSTGAIGAIDDMIPATFMAGDDLSVIAGNDLSVISGDYSQDNLSVIAGDYDSEMF
jgi:hypothetical protein